MNVLLESRKWRNRRIANRVAVQLEQVPRVEDRVCMKKPGSAATECFVVDVVRWYPEGGDDPSDAEPFVVLVLS